MKISLSPDLSLPTDVVTQTIGILAKRRAGKSFTARRLAEQLFKAGQQIVIIDPKGDWWGIRSAANGRDPGLPIVILGGERADVPLEVGAGEVVAKLVAEERVSVLLDLSSFRKGEVATFMTGFLENLYRLKAREANRTSMMLIIDEADAVAPQRPMKGEERMLGAAEDIVRRGGQRGIGCTLITQRSAVLNKNVLTQSQVLIALRTIAPQDLAAMDAWIDVHGSKEERATLMASLPALPVGEAWVWSPGWPDAAGIFKRIQVARIETFDSGATPGGKAIVPKRIADVDLEALRKQMASTIERAKAENPRELKKRIAELEAAAKKALAKSTPAAKTERVEVPVVTEAMARRLEKALDRLDRIRDAAAQAQQVVATEAGSLRLALERVVAGPARAALPRPPALPPPRVAAAPRRQATASAEGLTGVAQRILSALAELEQLGANSPAREMVAFLSGYSNLNSKGFVNGIGALRSAGLVDYPAGGAVALTDAGRAAAVYPVAPQSAQEVQQRVIAALGGASGRILQPLIDTYPAPIDRTALAAAAGYGNLNSKGFVNAIGRLRTLGFIDYASPGTVVAKPVLFLEQA